MKGVYIVIPAYNENSRLINVIKGIRKLTTKLPVVIVDDGSRKPFRTSIAGVTVIRHVINLGKGAALISGIEYSLQNGAQAMILMDGDGQHDPAEILKFVKHLDQGYELVFGSRRPSLKTPLVRLLGNKLASIYINLFFGIYISDILSGYRAITKHAYAKIKWQSSRYGVETEMIARLGRHKDLNFIEIPIEAIYIDKYKGVTIVDAFKILINSIWWKLS